MLMVFFRQKRMGYSIVYNSIHCNSILIYSIQNIPKSSIYTLNKSDSITVCNAYGVFLENRMNMLSCL